MSAKDRRERQKQATREGILSAALQLARTEGWTAVTVRRVAELVEYTPPIIYEYFANKGALLEELQAQGFASLAERVKEARGGSGDARARVLRVGDAYVNFAYEQPELYQLMHGWDSVDIPVETTLAWASTVGDTVQDCLVAWATEQGVSLPDPAGAVVITWGVLHGLISVEMLGRIGGGKARVRELATQTVEALLAAWATG